MRNISIAGDLGSGKSSVAKKLCSSLSLEYFSTGTLQRKLAAEKGMSTLELNYLSEKTREIDDYIDAFLKNIDNQEEKAYLLDSRLAWFFVKKSFKVYLTVNSIVAAQRVLHDSQRQSEPELKDFESSAKALQERQEVENRRFLKLYGINCRDLKNYDFILDTSEFTIEQCAEKILQAYFNNC